MSKHQARTLLLAAVAAATVVASAAAPHAAADQATPQPEAAAVPPPVPDGYRWIVDATSTIGLAIPIDWEVSAVSFAGPSTPTIDAAPPGHGIDGLIVSAHAYTGNPEPWDPSTCDPMQQECSTVVGTAAFDNGRFAGFRQTVEECCGAGFVDRIGAVDDDRSMTIEAIYAYGDTRDDAVVAVVDTILSTITRVGELPSSASGGSVFPYADFYAVPQLGTEPVHGTGCGANGEIGDVIPDGIWAGFVDEPTPGAALSVDLVCVFTPQVATGILDEGTSTILNADPNWLVVNNNERERSMPASADLQLRDAVWTDAGCVEGPLLDVDHVGYLAWINIAGGQATYVLWGCDWFAGQDGAPDATPLPPAQATSSLAPAHPIAGDPGSVWPYGEFWNVPQLGDEPVRGSGCGASGQVGSTIPDGLWAGYVSHDPATDTLWVDLLCIFAGAAADAVRAEGTATIVHDEPDYLVVNNNTQRRQVANNTRAILESDDVGDGCRPFGVSGADVGGPHLTDLGALIHPDHQAWIRIDRGAATWIAYGCDAGVSLGG